MIDIDRFQEILTEVFDEQPECCLDELNGGICLLPQCKINPKAKNNDLFVLGEFCRSFSMGRYINIYYGSFERLYGNCNEGFIRKKITEVLQHEIYHHIESLSGTHELEDEDERFMQKYLASKNKLR